MPDESPSASVNRELVAKITAAYVRHNQVGADQLATVITTVHRAFTGLGKPVAEASVERTPAVPIRRSVHRTTWFASNVGGVARWSDGT